MKTASTANEKLNARKYVKPILIGLMFGTISVFVLLIVFAAVMAFKDIPQAIIPAMAILAVAVGGFVAGFVAARIVRERGMMIGFVTGAVISVVILFAGVIVLKDSLSGLAFTKFAVALVSSAIGGIMGVNGKHRR